MVSAFIFKLLSLLPFALWVLLVFLAWFEAGHLTLGTSSITAAPVLRLESTGWLKLFAQGHWGSHTNSPSVTSSLELIGLLWWCFYLKKKKKKKKYFCEESPA